jgi:dihydrofolate reductase
MGRIVVSQFVSVDGVVEDPVGMEGLGRGDWSSSASRGDEGTQMKLDEIRDAAAMLFGRKTYDAYVVAWPDREGDYPDAINAIPKYVVSSTLTDPEWNNTTVVGADAVAAGRNLRDEVDGDILIQGSIQLVDELFRDGLVDEWRLMTFPVVVGAGRRCFADPGESRTLKMTDSRVVGDGVTITTYVPA